MAPTGNVSDLIGENLRRLDKKKTRGEERRRARPPEEAPRPGRAREPVGLKSLEKLYERHQQMVESQKTGPLTVPPPSQAQRFLPGVPPPEPLREPPGPGAGEAPPGLQEAEERLTERLRMETETLWGETQRLRNELQGEMGRHTLHIQQMLDRQASTLLEEVGKFLSEWRARAAPEDPEGSLHAVKGDLFLLQGRVEELQKHLQGIQPRLDQAAPRADLEAVETTLGEGLSRLAGHLEEVEKRLAPMERYPVQWREAVDALTGEQEHHLQGLRQQVEELRHHIDATARQAPSPPAAPPEEVAELRGRLQGTQGQVEALQSRLAQSAKSDDLEHLEVSLGEGLSRLAGQIGALEQNIPQTAARVENRVATSMQRLRSEIEEKMAALAREGDVGEIRRTLEGLQREQERLGGAARQMGSRPTEEMEQLRREVEGLKGDVSRNLKGIEDSLGEGVSHLASRFEEIEKMQLESRLRNLQTRVEELPRAGGPPPDLGPLKEEVERLRREQEQQELATAETLSKLAAQIEEIQTQALSPSRAQLEALGERLRLLERGRSLETLLQEREELQSRREALLRYRGGG